MASVIGFKTTLAPEYTHALWLIAPARELLSQARGIICPFSCFLAMYGCLSSRVSTIPVFSVISFTPLCFCFQICSDNYLVFQFFASQFILCFIFATLDS